MEGKIVTYDKEGKEIVIQSDEETKNARLLLAVCVKQTIKNSLSLLGIDVLEKM